ncbi:MAG TPA: AAA family ATPase [Mycobacteriales bacterium]|nr:AAA family ATPase [Mycobacteriales bacterium]
MVYQAALRNELTRRLGVDWTPVSRDGQAEIAGVPAELIALWSKRTVQVTAEAAPQIAAYETALGRPLTSTERTAVTKVAVVKTRPGKEPVDIATLTGRWAAEAAAAGISPAALAAVVGRRATHPLPGEVTGVPGLLTGAVRAAGARRAVFSRSDLAGEIAARVPAVGFSGDMVRELVEHWTNQALTLEETVPLRPATDGPARPSDARYASATTLALEAEVLAIARVGRAAGAGLLDAYPVITTLRGHRLDPDQYGAVGELLTDGNVVSVLVAPAGTGKTRSLAAAVDAWQAGGQHVIALAPTARAAKELGLAAGFSADTVAKFLHEQPRAAWQPPTPANEAYLVGPGSVLVVDEASMLATADLHALTQLVWDRGAKLVLVGDPAQIGAIDRAGGMLPLLAATLDAPELGSVHRFDDDWERHASLALRRGDPASIPAYLYHGRVHTPGDRDQTLDALFAHYTRLSTAGRRVLMLARTHTDVDALNTRARTWAQETGAVHGEPLLADTDRDWRAGDRLRATRNNRRIRLGDDYLRNGDLLEVTGPAPSGGLTVHRIDSNDSAVLPADYVRVHTAYGWASTIDAAQGATIDDGLLLARPGLDRTRLYVGLTRGRHTNHLYLAPAAEPEIRARGSTQPPVDPAAALHGMLNTVDDSTAATPWLPDNPSAPAPSRDLRRTLEQRYAEAAARAAQPHADRDYTDPHDRYLDDDRDRSRGRGR